MSDVMMKALQLQVESLMRQVSQLGPENERVRKLLTEFDQRHDADKARIAALEAENADLSEACAKWAEVSQGNYQRAKDAEAERDGLKDYAQSATKTITGLTGGGSEFFGPEQFGFFTADMIACEARIRERFEAAHKRHIETASKVKALEAALAKAELALLEIDALDPEGKIDGCSQTALRGLVLRMGEIARDAREARKLDA